MEEKIIRLLELIVEKTNLDEDPDVCILLDDIKSYLRIG